MATPEIDNPASLERALRSRANLFLGGGFSVLANDVDGDPVPVGAALADELRARWDADIARQLTLPQLYTLIASTSRDDLDAFLRRRFLVGDYDARYQSVLRIKSEVIFTTNVDNLIPRIFENSKTAYLSNVDFDGPTFRDRRAVDYIPLHGSVLRADRPLRFGPLDLASSFATDPDRWRYLRVRLQRSPTVFWGYALEDAGTLQALRASDAPEDAIGENWIVIRRSDADGALVDYLRALRFQIIRADTDELLEYLATLGGRIEVSPRELPTAERFPSDVVPTLSQVPSRPIEDFFQGAAPAWSDVHSHQLYRTRHFRVITEFINAGRSVIVTGIPASGKTTLLMQIAAGLDIDAHKLVLDYTTLTKSDFIVRTLDGDSAVIFVDNAMNDVFALNKLVEAKNVIAVGADRDFALTSVVNQIDRAHTDIIDVTDLVPSDLQGLRTSIPERIRSPEYVEPEMSGGVRPSIFEFVQSNVHGQRLAPRVIAALRKLRSDEPLLAETLLFVCYVHSCRTPVAMDMALAYLRDHISDYEDVYEIIRQVGALLNQYEGDLGDDAQDYFAARSTIVAETVMTAAHGSDLRHVLQTFHNNISPSRIPAYHVFRRRAYDSGLFVRAFADTNEAVALYDEIYLREPSPYVLQQKAIFLTDRHEFAEAFREIDRALAATRGRNWTIQNSHAQILFRANIDKVREHPEARETLDRSLRILQHCYSSDRRKGFHALTYADFARRYWRTYRDATARDYLEQARQWLQEAQIQEPWLKRAPVLLRVVEAHLNEAA